MPVDITEYRAMARDDRGVTVPCGQEPSIRNQTLAVGGASASSAAFNGATRFVRVRTDEPVRVAFGENPVAAADSMPLAQSSTEYFGVVGGHKLAVISAA